MSDKAHTNLSLSLNKSLSLCHILPALFPSVHRVHLWMSACVPEEAAFGLFVTLLLIPLVYSRINFIMPALLYRRFCKVFLPFAVSGFFSFIFLIIFVISLQVKAV